MDEHSALIKFFLYENMIRNAQAQLRENSECDNLMVYFAASV